MNTAQVFHVTATVVAETCCVCGCIFGIPSTMQAELRRSHKLFYCPAGHSQTYTGESDRERADRIQRELEAVRTSRDAERARAGKAESSLASLRKRVANGVCPCCKRSFTNLQRHMRSKHPAEVASANAE